MWRFWLSFLLISFCSPIQAQYSRIYQSFLQPQLNEIRVTTHPKNDFDPVVSNDGKWLVFVSDRSGNRDLWIKSTQGRQAFQITFHKSADYSPCWAPNNQTIYFISTRTDAEGDLWRIKFNPKKLPDTDFELKQVDTYLGYDSDASCSSDGKYIAITTTRLSGKRNIWILNPETENIVPFTFSGGEAPSWSPDGKWIVYSKFLDGEKEPQTDLFIKQFRLQEIFSGMSFGDNSIQLTNTKLQETFPILTQAENSYSLFFLRYEYGNNKDQVINFEDFPSLLSCQIDSMQLDSLSSVLEKGLSVESLKIYGEKHLTSAEKYMLHPSVSRGEIYYTSRENSQFDIMKISDQGSVPQFLTAQRQFSWADSTFNLKFLRQLEIENDSVYVKAKAKVNDSFFSKRRLAFQAVRERFTSSQPWSTLAGLEIAKEHVRSGNKLLAFQLYRELLSEVSIDDSLYVQINLNFWNAREFKLQEVEKFINDFLDLYQSNPSVLAKIQLYLAKKYKEENNQDKTLKITPNIIDLSSDIGDPYFEALQLQADIFFNFGSQETAIDQYLKIINERKSNFWQQLACKKIIELLLKDQENLNSAVLIQNAIQKYDSYPVLAFELIVWLGKHFWQNQNPRLALRELDRISQRFSAQKIANLKAGILKVTIYDENRQLDEAIFTCQQLIKRQDLTDQERAFFQQKVWDLQFERAEKWRKEKDFQVAYNLYRLLVADKPQNVEAQRGLISCAFELDKLSLLEKEYKNILKENSNDEYLLYALGLIYSFKFEDNVKGIIQSNKYLEHALQQNPELIYGYLTLSFNYERLELFQRQYFERKRSWFVRSGRTLFAPVIWLYRTLTLRKAAKFQNWYEQAIELLLLAISINDEKENPQLEALLCFNLANNFYQMGEYGHEKAYEYYVKKTKYDSTFSGLDQQAIFYHRLGHAAISVEDWPTAKTSLNRAITLNNQLKNIEQVQVIKKLLALSYQFSGDFEMAIETFQSTLPTDKKQKSRRPLLETYRNIAYNHLLLEETEEVRQYCLKALDLLDDKHVKKRKRPSTAIRFEFLGYSIPLWSLGNLGPSAARSLYGFSSEDERALLYTILAQNATDQKDFFQALSLMREKLAVFRKIDDVLGRAIVENNIGMIHIALENYKDAWNWFRSSFITCNKENFLSGEIINVLNLSQLLLVFEQSNVMLPNDSQIISIWLTETIDKLADFPYAYQKERIDLYHQKALLSFSSLKKTASSDTSASDDLIIPAYLKNNSQLVELIEEFEKAAELARQNAFFRLQTIIWKNLGELLQFTNLIPEAKQYFENALVLAKSNDFSDLEWRLQVSLGNLIADNDLSSDSLRADYFNQARQILLHEKIFNPQKQTEELSKIDRNSVYFNLIEHFCDQGDFQQTLSLTEEYQSLQKLDQLHAVDFSFGSEYKKLQAGNYLYYLQEINRLEKKVGEIKRSRRGGYRLFYQIIDTLAFLKSDFDDLVSEMRENDPELLSLYRPLNLSLDDVQTKIKKNQALSAFFADENNLYNCYMTADSLDFHKSNISKIELTSLINRFHVKIKSDSVFPEESAHYFYERLIQPFEKLLEDKNELIIIGENPISNLPFELIKNKSGWLVDQYIIYHFPTLTDFYLSFFARRLSGNKLTWLGASPDFTKENKLSNLQINHTDFSSLTERKFRSEINQCDYLIVNRPLVSIKQPVLQSYFRFKPSQTKNTQTQFLISPFSNEQDGFFHLSDLFEQESKSMFVFLLYPQDSLSFTFPSRSVEQTAWRNAGIPASIILRWPISGEIKNEFMQLFLKAIEEKRFIDAFYDAQKELRNKYKNPTIWGAFTWCGFPGLAPDEKARFSQDQFVSTVFRGQQLESEGFFQDALSFYYSAKRMAEALHDSTSLINLDETILLAASEGKLYEEAIAAQKRLIKFYQQKNKVDELIPAYNNLFYFYTQLNNSKEALNYKKRYNELLLSQNEIQAQANSLRETGILLEKNDENEEALNYYIQSLEIFTNLKFEQQVALLHLDIGRIKMNTFDLYPEAVNHFQTANQIFLKSEDKSGLATSLQNLGLAYEKMGMYSKSFELQKNALVIARQTNDDQTIGLNFQYLANLHWKTGDFLPALNFGKEASKIFEKLQNTKFLTMSHSTLGLIYNSLRDSALSIQHFEKAYNYALESDDLLDQATVLKNLGLVYSHYNQFDKAILNFNLALELDSMLFFQRGLAYDYRNLGYVLIEQKKYQDAVIWLRRAKNKSKSISDRRNYISSLTGLGYLFLKQNSIDSSFVYFSEADSFAAAYKLENLRWQALMGLGNVLFEEKKYEEAINYYTLAKDIIEQTRHNLQIEEYQAGFLTDKLIVYDKLIECYFQLKNPEVALKIAEQARSKHLVDLLSGTGQVFSTIKDSNLVALERMIQDSINALQTEISLSKESIKLDSIEKELRRKRNRLTTLWNEIKVKNNELGQILSTQSVPVDSLQRFLSDSCAIILFHSTIDWTYIFFVSKNEIYIQRVEKGQQDLEQLVKLVRNNLNFGVTTEDEFKDLADILWKPIKEIPDQIKQLVFIPHKILHYFPFAALKIDEDHFLLDEYSISNAPSLTSLYYCLQKGDEFSRTKGLIKKVLAVGNPDLQRPEFDLPFAEKEVVSVQREFSEVTAFLEKEATETKVLENVSDSDLILFACHGEYSPENPLFSSLLFTPDSLHDGRLEAWEIFQLQLSPFLIAMSACETGIGKILAGDDVVGLNRSLIYAGTPAIVSTLWKVDDLTTAVIMKRFFRLLKRGFSRSEALREAQLYVRNNVEVNPLYWAAFCLTGDFR